MDTSRVDISRAFGYGWNELKKNFWYFVGISVIYAVLTSLPNGRDGNHGWGILGIFISAWLTGGLYRLLLDYKAGTKQEFTVLFTQFKQFWRILLGTILLGLIVAGGLILLIVPGIYWGLKYQFTIMLIVDKDMQITDALRRSGDMTKGIIWPLFMFALAALGIFILGGICLGVGILVAMPVIWLAYVSLYKSLEVNASVNQTPA